jgi:hypothetical protein
MFVRMTHGKVLNLIQKNGAKIHFNEIELPNKFNDLIENNDEEQIVSTHIL